MLAQGHIRSKIGAPRRLPLLVALLAGMQLMGCSQQEGSAAKDAPTQVAAKVNGTEVSVHQINFVMSRTRANADSPEAAKALRKQVLDKLVDQQLLVQKAVDDKLDRTPDVQMALEAARREVLADAYIKQVATPSTKPDDNQVLKYFNDNPDLFAQRRIYQLQEISFASSAPEEVRRLVKEAVDSNRSFDEVTRILSARNVEFNRSSSQRAAEQISLELLPKIARLSPGQSLQVNSGAVSTVVFVKSSEAAPVSRQAAAPRISQFLANQSISQNAADMIKNLRSKAQIEYLGDFAAADAENSPK